MLSEFEELGLEDQLTYNTSDRNIEMSLYKLYMICS